MITDMHMSYFTAVLCFCIAFMLGVNTLDKSASSIFFVIGLVVLEKANHLRLYHDGGTEY
jgi:hypothetical protein